MHELTTEQVTRQAQASRRAEYAAVRGSGSQFLNHVRRERRHRDFSASEAETLMLP